MYKGRIIASECRYTWFMDLHITHDMVTTWGADPRPPFSTCGEGRWKSFERGNTPPPPPTHAESDIVKPLSAVLSQYLGC
jgi:hypothetical protein